MLYSAIITEDIFMAYFLKVSHTKKGDYLQIYESYRNKEKKTSCHRAIKPIGYVSDLIAKGIADPIPYYKNEVAKINAKMKKLKDEEKIKKIDDSPIKNIGYFLVSSMMKSLGIQGHFDLLDKIEGENISTYDYLLNMISARIICPSSKLHTYEEILPSLYNNFKISKDQIYSKLGFIGTQYERILEIFNEAFNQKFKRKTNKVYFDCTNYYFEIDHENGMKQKGPSKENRKEPIIGMGLLLDEDQIPLTMKLYPGNESEKPIIRQCINEMKNRYKMTGKTIQVADKGLNCAKNIVEALENGDGYIYSQSVKKLESKEQVWVLLDNDYINVEDENGEILYKYKYCIDDFAYKIDGKKIVIKQIRVATFNRKLAAKQLAEIDKQVDKALKLSKYANKKSQYGDSAKYVTFTAVNKNGVIDDESEVEATLNLEKINKDKRLAGYNLIISSELNMKPQEIYNVYHRLWRIEETFRILKSQLNTRPVYVRKEENIYGHMLICYLSVFILRTLQIKKFKDEIHTHQIIDFIRNFNVIKEKDKAVNISSMSKVLSINSYLNLNLDNYYLSKKDIENMFKLKL